MNRPGGLSSHPKNTGKQKQPLHCSIPDFPHAQDYPCALDGLSWRRTPAPSNSVCSWKSIQQDYIALYFHCSILVLTTILPSALRLLATYIIYVTTHLPQNAPNKPTQGEHKFWFLPRIFFMLLSKDMWGRSKVMERITVWYCFIISSSLEGKNGKCTLQYLCICIANFISQLRVE